MNALVIAVSIGTAAMAFAIAAAASKSEHEVDARQFQQGQVVWVVFPPRYTHPNPRGAKMKSVVTSADHDTFKTRSHAERFDQATGFLVGSTRGAAGVHAVPYTEADRQRDEERAAWRARLEPTFRRMRAERKGHRRPGDDR